MPEIHLRPTGSSFLVGLIDLPPGDIQNYVNSLRPAIEDWGKESQRSQRSNEGPTYRRTKSDPRDFYKTCGYLGIGPWNFITLTLVSDYGLATRLGFIGHARSQDYFHANDISLVLDLTGDNLTAEKLRGINNLLLINQKLGITDVLKLPLNNAENIMKRLSGVGQQGRVSLLPRDNNNQYLACFRPIYLNHIYTGQDSIYGFATDKTTTNTLIKEHETDMRSEGRRIPDEKDLISFHQLKTNPILNIKYHKGITKFIYLTILAAMYEHISENVLNFPPSSYPSMIRPLLSGGYFDFMVMMRGPLNVPMDSMLQKLKYFRTGDAITLLEEKCLDTLIAPIVAQLKAECLEMPLFKLSHTTTGVPFTKIAEAEHTMKQELYAVEVSPDDPSDVVLGKYIRALGSCYGKIKYTFRSYNYPKRPHDISESWEKYKQKFIVYPRTAISVKASRGPEVAEVITKFKDIHQEPSELLEFMSSASKISNGRYDFYLFDKGGMYFGDFLTKLQIMRNLLQLSGYLPRDNMHLFERRLRSPLLGLQTVIAVEFLPGKRPPSDRLYRGFAQTVFRKPICILTQDNIDTQLKNLDRKCGPDHTHPMKAALQRNLKTSIADWEAWFEMVKAKDLPNQKEAFVLHHADSFIQSGLDLFLKKRFSREVSPETLEALLSTFCLIDGFLADPLLFDLYLDVVPFLNHFLVQLFTLESRVEEGFDPVLREQRDMVRLYYVDPEMDRIRQITPTRPPYVGIEAYFIRIVDLIQKVLGQRQPGSFPNYDRSFSRLSDLKIQQGKTMTGLSWMAKNLIKNLRNHLPTAIAALIRHDPSQHGLQGISLDIDLDSGISDRRRCRIQDPRLDKLEAMKFSDSNFLPHFSNAPEALLYRFDKSISLNARHLTSIERIVMMAHEIGHLVVDPLEEVNLFPLPPVSHLISDSRIKSGEPLKEILPAHAVRPEKVDELWQEVFADLMVYRLCFRPCSLLYDGSFNGQVFHPDKPRVNRKPTGKQFDICDDFLMAWIFQLLLLAKIKLPSSFKSVFDRLMIELALLKFFFYYDAPLPGTSADQVIGTVFDEQIIPFLRVKLPGLLNRFRSCGNEVPLMNLKESFWKKITNDPPGDRESNSFEEDLKETLQARLSVLIDSRSCSPFFHAVQFLASPPAHGPQTSTPYFDNVLLDKREDVFKIMNGLRPDHLKEATAADSFAAALQIAGFINLGYVQDFKNHVDYCFPNAYPGYRQNQEQQGLAVSRLMLRTFLLQGRAEEMRNFLIQSGIFLEH